jgi:ParB family chromosome partitioning protein
MKKGRGLGRGLDALLPATPPQRPASAAPSAAAPPPPDYGTGNVFLCALEKISPQKGQPRQHFDASKLEELAGSIREHGLLEPLVVRRVREDQFELIAGERRFRACQKAGLREALVVVHEVSSSSAFELAIIENVQREDLDPIELAEALDRLVKEHGYTQEKLAARIGKDRSTIANSLRLLRLPEMVRTRIVQGELSEGHGRALLGLEQESQMVDIAEKIIHGRLSVRQTEELVRGKKKTKGGKPGAEAEKKSASVRDLEKRLERKLGARCEVKDKNGTGQLVIRYGDLDELDRILELIL